MTSEYWIEHLKLLPHPEGGFYRETYRATGELTTTAGDKRNHSTAIYFLLRAQDRSLFHKIKSDELWHFHAGGRLTLYVLSREGLITRTLGQNVDEGDTLQLIVPANHWFAARVTEGPYVLSGCTVSPGFDFRDFEVAQRQNLLAEFPDCSQIINELT